MAKLIDNTSTIQELINRVNGLPTQGDSGLCTLFVSDDGMGNVTVSTSAAVSDVEGNVIIE